MDNDLLKKYKRNLVTLTEVEVNFYDFSLKNYNLFLTETISEIAKKFGTGLSFIYGFFEKLGIKSLKEYIFFLGVVLSEKNILFQENKTKNEIFEKEVLLQKTIENIYEQYRLLENQLLKINQLADEIHQNKDIFFIGLGFGSLIFKKGQRKLKNFSEVASARAIATIYEEITGKKKDTKVLFDLYKIDNKARRAIKTVSENLANLVANIYFMLDPDIILIGGAISKNKLFIKLVTQATERFLKTQGYIKEAKIIPASLGNDANLFGAYYLSE